MTVVARDIAESAATKADDISNVLLMYAAADERSAARDRFIATLKIQFGRLNEDWLRLELKHRQERSGPSETHEEDPQ